VMKLSLNALSALAICALLACFACDHAGGRPGANAEVKAPNEDVDFGDLYSKNCAGCHGRAGMSGAAIPLADPVFLAIADDAAIRRTISTGMPGTPMPAFAMSAGGMLTDKQIDALVSGIRGWSKPDDFGHVNLPSYAETNRGDSRNGAEVYRVYCSSCHGADGRGARASSIVDPSYLSLVSNQNLRTNVIVGRPALRAPDWRSDVPGTPMSEQQISDVVAWLASHRPAGSNESYAGSSIAKTGGTE
jgi:cytochrome c oxidase cbb3-type subunit III